LALIRSMLLRSEILLLDEVTASLDIRSKQSVEQLLKEWHVQELVTLIWVSHDLEQARHVSSRIWFMAEATLLEDCASQDFFHKPTTEQGRSFLQWTGSTGGEE
jgi:putative ABC transport system ATP-binding protein